MRPSSTYTTREALGRSSVLLRVCLMFKVLIQSCSKYICNDLDLTENKAVCLIKEDLTHEEQHTHYRQSQKIILKISQMMRFK